MEKLGYDFHHKPRALHTVREAARQLERSGFTGIYFPEALGYSGDSLQGMQLAAEATSTLEVGSVVSNIHLRNAALMATAVSGLAELYPGRISIGLGVAHKLFNEPYGVTAGRPLADMRNYITAMRKHLYGNPPPPIYIGGLRPGMVRLAGELADGVMHYMVPQSRLKEVVVIARKAAGERALGGSFCSAALVQAAIDDDIQGALSTAKQSIASHLRMENYRAAMREWGFAELAECAADVWGERADVFPTDTAASERFGSQDAPSGVQRVLELISDDLADELFVLGPPARCRERLRAYRDAGIELPIINAFASGNEPERAFQAVLETFGKR